MHPADQPITPSAARHARQGGFTLIEVVIVMVILAIVTAIALPSFNDTLARNRVSAQNNEIVAAVNLARTLAVQTRSQAGFCGASATFDACSANFDNGFIVWVDENRNGTIDADEVRRAGELDDRLRLTGTADIRFDRRGQRTVPAGAGLLQLRPVGCASGKPFVSTLSISNVGTLTQTRGNC